MVAAGRVIWWSMVAIYDETLLLLRSNIVWFLLSLPLAIPLLLATIVLVPPTPGEEFGTGWPCISFSFGFQSNNSTCVGAPF